MHFIDTNMLVGAADRTDDLHEIGKQVLTDVAKGRLGTTLVSDFVLDETLTILGLRRGVGAKIATKFVRAILASSRVRCAFVDDGHFREALTIYEKFEGRLSFTDATIVTVMRAHGCTTLFSHDKGFDRVPGIVRKTASD